MKAYKGFEKDMTCRGFMFEENKTYHEDKVQLCDCGFHACEYPLDCFINCRPIDSLFREVELEEVKNETNNYSINRVAKTITIGRELDIDDMVKESIQYIKSKINSGNSTSDHYSVNSSTGEWSVNTSAGEGAVNSTTGERSGNTSTGVRAANLSTGDRSANMSAGRCSINSTTGDHCSNSSKGYGSINSTTGGDSANMSTGRLSANTSTGLGSVNMSTGLGSVNSTIGVRSVNTSTGVRSVNTSMGNYSANSANGYGSVNISTGNDCRNEGAEGTLNIGVGNNNICRGKKGAYIILAEYGEWDGEKYPLLNVKLGYIDGKNLKEDTWYELKNGEFVEVQND